MLFSKFKGTLTTVGGIASFNTPKFSMGYLRQLVLQPTSSDNIYDLSIIDDTGLLVLPTQDIQTTSLKGTQNFHKLDLPLVGIYTIQISNATADEAIPYVMLAQED